jgi:alanine dehydrogenase
VPWTSTRALTNATLPYVLKLAKFGRQAVFDDPALNKGLNTYQGEIVHPGVQEAIGMPLVTG